MLISKVCALTLVLLASAPVWGAEGNQQARLTASDASAQDIFGSAVAIGGDYILVGAGLDDDRGDNSGSAYVFYRNGNDWTQQAKLTAADGMAGDAFGQLSVSINGSDALIGAHYKNSNSGAAYVFNRVGGTWTQQAKLVSSDGRINDLFGAAVSLYGDYALVGETGTNANSGLGAAYVFHRVGSTWSQQAKLISPDGVWEAGFGNRVCLHGDYAVVSAMTDNPGGTAYVFQRSGSVWTEIAKLTPSDGAKYNYFGCSISVSDDYIFLGAPGDNHNTGAAYVFAKSGRGWDQMAKLTAPEGKAWDEFGQSVVISGDNAIISASLANNAGCAYWFHSNGLSWELVDTILPPSGAENSLFASPSGLDGNTLVLAAEGQDLGGIVDAGAVYVFTNVPEPATSTLWVLCALALVRRRRGKHPAAVRATI